MLSRKISSLGILCLIKLGFTATPVDCIAGSPEMWHETAHRPRRETDGEGARRRGLRTRFDFPPSLNQSFRSHSLSEVSPWHLDAELHAVVSSKPAPSPSPASGCPGRTLPRPWI